MLTNAYLLAKIGADTAENEQHFAEFLPIGRCVADRRRTLAATERAALRMLPTLALRPTDLRLPASLAAAA